MKVYLWEGWILFVSFYLLIHSVIRAAILGHHPACFTWKQFNFNISCAFFKVRCLLYLFHFCRAANVRYVNKWTLVGKHWWKTNTKTHIQCIHTHSHTHARIHTHWQSSPLTATRNQYLLTKLTHKPLVGTDYNGSKLPKKPPCEAEPKITCLGSKVLKLCTYVNIAWLSFFITFVAELIILV